MKIPTKIKVTSPTICERASGWWEDDEEDVAVRFYFSFNEDDSTLTVRVFNSTDGEEMLVHGLVERDDQLAFTTHCLSTQSSAAHRWRFVSEEEVEHHITFKERWKKAPADKYSALLTA